MNRKNKNKVLVSSLAAALILGASTFAYFTDRTESHVEGNAGTVILEKVTDNTAMENMIPGDVRDITLSTTYTGTLDAKVRVVFKDIEVKLEDGTVQTLALDALTEGFGILKGTEYVDPASYVIDLGVLSTGEPVSVTDLKLKLNEVSGNDWQGASVKLTYVVEALQDGHTTPQWTEEGGTEQIEILPA